MKKGTYSFRILYHNDHIAKRKFLLSFLTIFLGCCIPAIGQTLTWEQFCEDYVTTDADNLSSNELQLTLDELQELHENPLNVNNCTRNDLLQIPYIDAAGADSILNYVSRYGPMRSFGELQLIRGLDAWKRAVLTLFVVCGPGVPEIEEQKPWKHLGDGKNEIATCFGIPFYTRRGFRSTVNANGETQPKRYAGDKFYSSLRYRYTLGTRIDAGLTAEKDDGESFMKHGNYPFDSYSFFFRYRSQGFLNSLLIGDYRIQAGRGLVVGNSVLLNALSLVSSANPGRQDIYRHASADEVHFLRGAAAKFQMGIVDLTVFASYRKLDAILKDQAVTSLLQTGYHRLPLERRRKGDLGALTTGFSSQLQLRYFHFGATMAYNYYEYPFTHGSKSYQRYYPEGKNFLNYSLNYSYVRRKFSFGGETAVDNHGGAATLADLRWNPLYGYHLFLQQRYYDKRYHAPQAHAYSATGQNRNEFGLLLGGVFSAVERLRLTAYADLYRLPSACFLADKASTGYTFHVQAACNVSKRLLLLARYQLRARQETAKELETLRYRYKHTVRLQATVTPGPWQLTTLLDGCRYQPSFGNTEHGWMVSERVRVNTGGTRLSFWASYFHTDSYRSNIYAYQPSLLYYTSYPALFNHGYAGSAMIEQPIGRHFNAAMRFATIHYTNRKTIGSDDRAIMKSTKPDLMIQLRYLF